MRALVLDAERVLSVHNLPRPAPGADDMLLRVEAVGICGSDLHGYTGENGRRHPGQVMGHEAVARVAQPNTLHRPDIAAGELVTFNPVVGCAKCNACAKGQQQLCADRVVIGVEPSIIAAMAEYIVVPALNVVSVEGLKNPHIGALVEPLAVGEHAVSRSGATVESRVLVIGAGPIGQAACIALLRRGITSVVVSDPEPARRALIEQLGINAVAPTDLQDEYTSSSPDIVIDAVGSSATLQSALTVSTMGATIVLVGMNEPTLQLAAYGVSVGERVIVGSFCYSAADFQTVADWVVRADIDLSRLIDSVVSLDGAPEAFAGLTNGTWQASKVLVSPLRSTDVGDQSLHTQG